MSNISRQFEGILNASYTPDELWRADNHSILHEIHADLLKQHNKIEDGSAYGKYTGRPVNVLGAEDDSGGHIHPADEHFEATREEFNRLLRSPDFPADMVKQGYAHIKCLTCGENLPTPWDKDL